MILHIRQKINRSFSSSTTQESIPKSIKSALRISPTKENTLLSNNNIYFKLS